MTFMPFLTAGDPGLETTSAVLTSLRDSNADLIELGFPYSDPIADGPVIQASYTRALDNGLTVDGIFSMMDGLETDSYPPILAMVSYAIIFRFGVAAFARRAASVGFSGLIVPDLPSDEAEELLAAAHAAELDLVQLIAPTTSTTRTAQILKASSGFVYCISVAGTTGERQELPTELLDQLSRLRQQTHLPLAVGFGIGSPEQVPMLDSLADGVIVGSAIVRLMASAASPGDAANAVGTLAAEMRTATGKARPTVRTQCENAGSGNTAL